MKVGAVKVTDAVAFPPVAVPMVGALGFTGPELEIVAMIDIKLNLLPLTNCSQKFGLHQQMNIECVSQGLPLLLR